MGLVERNIFVSKCSWLTDTTIRPTADPSTGVDFTAAHEAAGSLRLYSFIKNNRFWITVNTRHNKNTPTCTEHCRIKQRPHACSTRNRNVGGWPVHELQRPIYSNHHHIRQREHEGGGSHFQRGHAFNEWLKDETKTEDPLCKMTTIRKKKNVEDASNYRRTSGWWNDIVTGWGVGASLIP